MRRELRGLPTTRLTEDINMPLLLYLYPGWACTITAAGIMIYVHDYGELTWNVSCG